MITLLIDTSSKDVSIAILEDKNILASITKSIPNAHSIYTVSFIDQMLKKAKLDSKDINNIMVVVGPGSFTGIRIGVTIAKTYAYLNNISIIPISSLKMRSISISHDNCLSIIDAHHDNYYIGLYNHNNEDIIEEKFTNKEEVLKIIEEYKPTIVSDIDGCIDNILYKETKLDFQKIVEYYKDEKPLNPHLVNPKYLKQPQALEERKWYKKEYI